MPEIMDPELDIPVCLHCSESMEWLNCEWCSGEGWVFDAMAGDDPDDDDLETCPNCDGSGGEWICLNWRSHVK